MSDPRAVIEGVDVNVLPEYRQLVIDRPFELDFKPLRATLRRSESAFGRALRNSELQSGGEPWTS